MGTRRRVEAGHENSGTSSIAKRQPAATLKELKSIRPHCACGCGELLIIPEAYLRNCASLETFRQYWSKYPYKKNHRVRSRTISWETKLQQLEAARPLCACGCGERLDIPTIARKTSVAYIKRYWEKHPTRQNHYKLTSVAERMAALETLRPVCACGCGELLEIPTYFFSKSPPATVASVQSHWQRHPYRRGHGLWDTRTQKFLAAAEELDSELLGLIYGTLLGDSAITYPNSHSRFPRLAFGHAARQRAWLEYKAERLSKLRPTTWEAPNVGYGEGKMAVYCNTACHPQLCEVFAVVKPDNQQKTVSRDWLNRVTPEGLAWWYMDDGSLSYSEGGSPRIQMHTEGFSDYENQIIVDWLGELGYPCRKFFITRGEKRYSCIALGASTARKWLADLREFAIPAMDYKFRNR